MHSLEEEEGGIQDLIDSEREQEEKSSWRTTRNQKKKMQKVARKQWKKLEDTAICPSCSPGSSNCIDGVTTQDVGSIQKDTSGQEWEVIEVTLDSGACETVAPERIGNDIPIEETEASKSGLMYTAANG